MIPVARRIESSTEYYFSTKLRQVRAMIAEGKPVINLGIGNPDLPPHPRVVNSLVEEAKKDNVHGYQAYKGIPALRQSMSNFMNKHYEVKVDATTSILPLMGSKEGIMHICMAFLNQGDKLLVPNPGYPTYAAVGKLVEAEVLTYELDEAAGWNIDLAALKKMDLDAIKIMMVNFPNMPTGSNGNIEVLTELITLAEKHAFLIVNDNPYSFVLNDNPRSMLSLPGAAKHVIELNSLSKSFNMAGWRIGWLSGDSYYIDQVLKVKSNMDSGMFLPLQVAACEALMLDEEWFETQNENYAERRALIVELLRKLNCSVSNNASGMFVWAKVPSFVEHVEDWIEGILQEAHVFLTPGFIFGSAGQRYIRLSLCSSIPMITEAMTRIEAFMSKEQAS